MDEFRSALQNSPPLLLFVVIALGHVLGQAKLKNFSLGVAGVLFVGLAFGMWSGPQPLSVPSGVMEVGLILFVYVVGLNSAAGFFQALKERGLSYNLCALAALVVGVLVAWGMGWILDISAPLVAGIYCGGLTNTPALAAVTQTLQRQDPASAALAAVGYSAAYPMGVLCALLLMQGFAKIHRDALSQDQTRAQSNSQQPLINKNFIVQNPQIIDKPIGELRVRDQVGVLITRLRRSDKMKVATKYTVLHAGDVVCVLGEQSKMDALGDYFGPPCNEHLELDRSEVDIRRVLVSDIHLAGKPIQDLALDSRFGAQITRLRRADIDLIPSPDTLLELGDRLRIVAPREHIAKVSKFFGDSEKEAAYIDYTAFTLGMSLGVFVGMIPLPLPWIGQITLGFAGGPLLVALLLGRKGRTGHFIWTIPFEASQTLQHLGLLLFLAAIGVRAGTQMSSALQGPFLSLVLSGVAVTTSTILTALILLRRFAHSDTISTLGATAGIHTQPASLAKARELTQSDLVFITYATTYPIGMIGKIILAQILLILSQ